MLHLVAFPPTDSALLRSLQHSLQAGDQVVFIEQGLLFCADGPVYQEALASLAAATLYRQVDDAPQEQAPKAQSAVASVTWDAIAALTETHTPCLSWY